MRKETAYFRYRRGREFIETLRNATRGRNKSQNMMLIMISEKNNTIRLYREAYMIGEIIHDKRMYNLLAGLWYSIEGLFLKSIGGYTLYGG